MIRPDARAFRVLRSWCCGVAVFAFVAVVTMLLLYLLHFYRPHFSSDDAVVNTLAESMWQQGRLLPHGWINNNGDLMMPSGSLLIAPLLAWLPNGYGVHALASVFAAFLMLGSLTWLLRVLRMPWAVVVFLATLVASGFSSTFTVMVFAQTTYVWWPAGFFLGAALIYRQRLGAGASPRSRWLMTALLFLLVFSISFANPGRVALMMVVPLYLFDRVLALGASNGMAATPAWQRWPRWLGASDPLTLVGLVVSFLSALLIYLVLAHMGVTEASYNAAALRWGGLGSVWRHAATFEGWFEYLGAPSDPLGTGYWPFAGLACFRWGIALWLTLVGITEVARLRRQPDIARRALAAALLGAFLPIFLLYLLFDPLAINAGTLRYFTAPICIVIALSAFGLRSFLQAFPRIGRVGLTASGILLIGVSAQNFIPVGLLGSADFWQLNDSRTMLLARTLQREHLEWGYATWWNAGSTMVQADSSIHVLPVILSPGGVQPFSYMVSRDWYRPSTWVGETFLALAREEMDQGQLEVLRKLLGEPLRSIDSGDYRILVFGRNISADFACLTQTSMNEPLVRGRPSARIVSADNQASSGDGAGMLRVRIRNEGISPMSGSGRYPMSVGVRLLDAQGTTVKPDWVHSPLNCPLDPGQERTFWLALPKVEPGDWRIRVDLVQEGVAWLGDWGVPPVEIPLAANPAPDSGSSPGK
jgi:hypothetical protein